MGIGVCVVINVALLPWFCILEVGTSQWTVISLIDYGVMALCIRNKSPSLVVASMVFVENEVSIIAVAVLVDAVERVEC